MHVLFRASLLIGLLVLALVGCDDDDGPTTPTNGGTVSIEPEGRLYVLNQADTTIYIYDTKTLARVDSFPSVVAEPHFVEFSPDGQHFYVVGRVTGGQVAKFRTSDNGLVEVVTVPTNVFPTALTLSDDNDTLYLTDFSPVKGRLHKYIVSGSSFTYSDSVIQAGIQTHDLGKSPDGKWIVSGGFGSDDLSVFNTQTGDVFPLTLDSAKQQVNAASNNYGPYGVWIDATSSIALVACRKGVDQLRLVDLNNQTILDSILIPVTDVGNATAGPTYMTIAPDNNIVFVTNFTDNTASVVRLSTREVLETIEFESTRSFTATMSDDGSRVYISCAGVRTPTNPIQGRVYVIDAETFEKVDSIDTGQEPFGIVYRPL